MLINNNEYLDIVETIKLEIKSAQYKAAVSVNRELIMLYYNIGKIINEHKTWGNSLSKTLPPISAYRFPTRRDTPYEI